jgi:sugar phosphate isomerase/epimerase
VSLPNKSAAVVPLALSTWSFSDPIFKGKLTPADALAIAAGLGFSAVEINDLFAAMRQPPLWLRAGRRGYRMLVDRLPWRPPVPAFVRRPRLYRPELVEQLARAAERAGVRVVSWVLDTDLTATGEALAAQRSYWRQGMETARRLGAEIVRIVTGGPDTLADGREEALLAQARNTLAEITGLAERNGLVVAVENHWGLSTDPTRLAALVRSVEAPRDRLGVCLDFGNFQRGRELEGIRLLAPLATHVHAKSYAFGPDGEEERLPYGAILRVLAAAGYRGWFVIEFEGHGDPIAGVQATRTLIERYWSGPTPSLA